MSGSRERLTVLICENELTYRQMLRRQLEEQGMVVLPCGDKAEAIEVAQLRQPDVALVDLYHPRDDEDEHGHETDEPWFAAAGEIRAVSPTTKVIAFTRSRIAEDVRGAMRARSGGQSFDGYLTKNIDIETVATHVQDAAAGGTPIDPQVAHRLLERPDVELDAVELRFLSAKRDGLKGRALQEAMPRVKGRLLSDRQIRRYASRVRQKFGVRTTEQALVKAIRSGFLH